MQMPNKTDPPTHTNQRPKGLHNRPSRQLTPASFAASRLPMTLTPATSLLLAATAAPPDRVIIISRHGVRQQFPSSVFNFSLYAPTRKFETSKVAWGVEEGMGVLTRHGYEAVSLMGAYQRQRYATLLSGCKAFIYCEEDMARVEAGC